MSELSACGRYELTTDELHQLREDFVGYFTDEDECRATVKRIYEKENRLIDTHTSVAMSAAERYMSDSEAKSAMLVVSTASAYKFAGDVLLSLTGEKHECDLDAPKMLKDTTKTQIPEPLERVLSKAPVHTEVICKEKMSESVIEFALK